MPHAPISEHLELRMLRDVCLHIIVALVDSGIPAGAETRHVLRERIRLAREGGDREYADALMEFVTDLEDLIMPDHPGA